MASEEWHAHMVEVSVPVVASLQASSYEEMVLALRFVRCGETRVS
jgi:hypothetical protein